MIKKLVHFSDLHIRLFKDHDLYRGILNNMLEQFHHENMTWVRSLDFFKQEIKYYIEFFRTPKFS